MNSGIFSDKKRLDVNVIRNILDSHVNKFKQIECVFHGGEPFFQAEDNTIQNYIELIKSYPTIKWSATTNLTYKLTDKLIELFSLFDKKFLKTSWDVDDYRFTTVNQRNIWENNVKSLLQKGFDVEVIVTLNKFTLSHKPSKLMNYFKELGIKIINFERITETGRAAVVKIKPDNVDIDKWLTELYIYNLQHHDIKIQLFEELENIIKGNDPIGCRERRCMENVITVNTDGTIATCPNISNIHIVDNNGYNESLHKKLISQERKLNERCLTCSYYNICRGECCQLSFDKTGCPGLKMLIDKIKENLQC